MAICKVKQFKISKVRSEGSDRVQLTLELTSNIRKLHFRTYWISPNDIFRDLNKIQNILEYGLATAKETYGNIEIKEYLDDYYNLGFVIFKLPVIDSRFRKDFPFSVMRV